MPDRSVNAIERLREDVRHGLYRPGHPDGNQRFNRAQEDFAAVDALYQAAKAKLDQMGFAWTDEQPMEARWSPPTLALAAAVRRMDGE